MKKSTWIWMVIALLLGGWLPPASDSVPDKTILEFYGGIPGSLKARVRHVAVSHDANGNVSRLVAYLDSEERELPNPWLAAGLSLAVPGAGQAYLGEWPRGALFLGTSLLLGGLAISLRDTNPTWGKTLGIGLIGISLISPLDAFWEAQRCGEP